MHRQSPQITWHVKFKRLVKLNIYLIQNFDGFKVLLQFIHVNLIMRHLSAALFTGLP